VYFTNNENLLGVCELQIVYFRVFYEVMLFSNLKKNTLVNLNPTLNYVFVIIIIFYYCQKNLSSTLKWAFVTSSGFKNTEILFPGLLSISLLTRSTISSSCRGPKFGF